MKLLSNEQVIQTNANGNREEVIEIVVLAFGQNLLLAFSSLY